MDTTILEPKDDTMLEICYRDSQTNKPLGSTTIPHQIAKLSGYLQTAMRTPVGTNKFDGKKLILCVTPQKKALYDATLKILADQEAYPHDEIEEEDFVTTLDFLLVYRIAEFIRAKDYVSKALEIFEQEPEDSKNCIRLWATKSGFIDKLYARMYTSDFWQNRQYYYRENKNTVLKNLSSWETTDQNRRLFCLLTSNEETLEGYEDKEFWRGVGEWPASRYVEARAETTHMHAPYLFDYMFRCNRLYRYIFICNNVAIKQLCMIDINTMRIALENCPNIRFDTAQLKDFPFAKYKRLNICNYFEEAVPEIHIKNCPQLQKDLLSLSATSNYVIEISKGQYWCKNEDHEVHIATRQYYRYMIYPKLSFSARLYYISQYLKKDYITTLFFLPFELFFVLPWFFGYELNSMIHLLPELLAAEVFIYSSNSLPDSSK